MNLLMQFFRREKPDGAKGLTINRAITDGFFPLSLRESGRVDTPMLQSMLSENELVYACIDIRATAATDPRLIVQRRIARRDGSGKVDYEEVTGHPFTRLLTRPNTMMSEGDLMRAAMVSWDTTSPRRFFCEKEYQRGLLVGLWPLNPAQMEPRYSQSENREMIGWRWSDGSGRYVDYTFDELIVREAPSWYRPAAGAAAWGSVKADQAQTDYAWAFFENGGMPSVYITAKDRVLNQQQRDTFRETWRSIYGNRRNKQHDVGVLDQSQEIQRIGSSLNELDNETLRQTTESRICMVYGVPPLIVYAYVGLLRSTYSNLKEAWSSFWDFTMSPLLKEWRLFWQSTLLAEFEEETAITSGRVRLWWDLTGVAALQDDVDALERRARMSVRSRLRTQNEGRAMLNLPPVVGGDVFLDEGSSATEEADDDA